MALCLAHHCNDSIVYHKINSSFMCLYHTYLLNLINETDQQVSIVARLHCLLFFLPFYLSTIIFHLSTTQFQLFLCLVLFLVRLVRSGVSKVSYYSPKPDRISDSKILTKNVEKITLTHVAREQLMVISNAMVLRSSLTYRTHTHFMLHFSSTRRNNTHHCSQVLVFFLLLLFVNNVSILFF